LSLYARRGKRAFDVLFSMATLVILSPMMVAIALLVRATMGRPVVFRQARSGYRGVPFTMLKFRSMTEDRDARGDLLPEHQRLTRLGVFLRQTSIDELPELLNVLLGQMSVVGPRPLLVEYMDVYSEEQKRRHDVPPGITGWSQINGRNTTDWEQRFVEDVWYVDNLSWWVDLRILALTVGTVLTMRGVKPKGREMTSKFRGSKTDR
jgi:sugar transferase EpsL